MAHAHSKTAEPAQNWGLPTLSQGATNARPKRASLRTPRGQSGLSPILRPIHSAPPRSHFHRCPISGPGELSCVPRLRPHRLKNHILTFSLRQANSTLACRRDRDSAGPPGPAEILPGAAIRVALRIKDLRARVFRGVELKHHPLRIGNTRIRRRVQELDFVIRELKVHGADVISQLQRRSHC